MSEQGPARRAWMLAPPPGLTSAIVAKEIARLGFKMHDAQLALREVDWLALRRACFASVGIPDPEAYERERITNSPAYTRWIGNLRQYQRARGME